MRYTDEQRVDKMLVYADKLMQYVKKYNISQEDILIYEEIQLMVSKLLEFIGEQAYCISEGFKDKTPQIPWNDISGMRHRLVHDYAETNWEIIADTVFNEIPVLIKQLQDLVK